MRIPYPCYYQPYCMYCPYKNPKDCKSFKERNYDKRFVEQVRKMVENEKELELKLSKIGD